MTAERQLKLAEEFNIQCIDHIISGDPRIDYEDLEDEYVAEGLPEFVIDDIVMWATDIRDCHANILHFVFLQSEEIRSDSYSYN